MLLETYCDMQKCFQDALQLPKVSSWELDGI